MNYKNKEQFLFRASGFFLVCLLAALFLFAACDSPLDDSQLDNNPADSSPLDNSPADNDDPPAQDDPPQDPPSDPPPDPPPLVYTVTFDKNGGATEAEPSQISVTWPDNTVDLPASPSGSGGLVFRGWNTNADGSGTRFTGGTEISENITVYARWGAPFETMVTDVADVAEWLSSQPGGSNSSSPVNLVLDIDLGDMADGSNWYALLDALDEAGDYVALDLSDCTMSGAAENGTVFYPNYAYKGPTSHIATYPVGGGKKYIVELTLPLTAKKIYGGWQEGYTMTPIPAFINFNNLAKIRGDNIEEAYVGPGSGHDRSAMFYNSPSLKEARFEKLIEASYFFYNCQKLEFVSCPSLAEIGTATFYGCKNLKTFDFSNVQSIERGAFGGSGLVTLDLGQSTVTKIPGTNGHGTVGSVAMNFPMAAFQGCSNLETIIFPACFTNIGNYKFLTYPDLRGGETFNGCSKINKVTFLGDPAAIDWLESGPPYNTGLEEALITLALSGSTPQERIGTYVKNGPSSWSKQ
ncbi:MAG: leucine-rich repeat protein [Treponema sp.]|jgi:hypothetical protein|nr:leucine-rich repeat protein [Treponema sp.]